jgi:hypothetical protein
MLRWYPYVPVGGEMAVNCAVLSYDGTMYFGFSGDVHAAPDLRRLEELLKLSFEELRDADGVSPPLQGKKNGRAKTREKTQTALKPAATVQDSIPLTGPPPLVKSAKVIGKTTEEDKVLPQMIA